MCVKLHTIAASNNGDHSIVACAHQIAYMSVMGISLHSHPIRGESHIQRNVIREVAKIYLD